MPLPIKHIVHCTLCAVLLASCATPSPTKDAATLDHTQSHIPLEPQGLWSERWISPSAYAHYAQARIHHNQKLFHQAVHHIKLALVFDEESPHLHAYAAHLFLLDGQLQEAQNALSSARKLNPKYAFTSTIHALLLQHQGAPLEEVLRTSKRATSLDPNLRFAFITHAQLLLHAKRFDSARTTLKTIAQRWPDDPFAHNQLGLLAIEDKRYQSALQSFTRLLELRPRSERVFLHIAFVQKKLHKVDKSYETYTKCTEKSPPAPSCWTGRILSEKSTAHDIKQAAEILSPTPKYASVLAEALYNTSSPKAPDVLQTFIQHSTPLSPSLVELHHILGLTFLHHKRPQEALKAFQRVPQTSAFFIEARSQTALLYSHDKRYDLAAESLNEAIKHAPELLDIRLLQSNLWEKNNDLRRALSPMTSAPKSLQDHPELLQRTAHLYTETRQHTKARAALRKLLSLQPNQPYHNARFALLLTQTPRPTRRDLRDASTYAHKALSLSSTPDPNLLLPIARVFLRTRAYTDALPILLDLHTQQPANLTILKDLTHALIKTHQPKRAAHLLRDAIASSTDPRRTQEIEALLRQTQKYISP